jgi:NitT/TauT family transport system permease protein
MRRIAIHAAQLLIAVALIFAWQLLSGNVVDKLLVSDPGEVWSQFIEWARDGTIISAILDTLCVVGAGLAIGALSGIGAGWIAGLMPSVRKAVTPGITVLFAIPKVALVPLFILWFGISYSERIVFTAVVVFFFMYFAALNGINSVPRALENVFKLTGAGLWQKIRLLYGPASLGWLLGGCRIAVPYAFVAAVTVEVLSSRSGIGFLIKTSATVLNPAGMFVGIVVLMITTSIAGLAIGGLERWSRWQL